jgi:hypothetical protein
MKPQAPDSLGQENDNSQTGRKARIPEQDTEYL